MCSLMRATYIVHIVFWHVNSGRECEENDAYYHSKYRYNEKSNKTLFCIKNQSNPSSLVISLCVVSGKKIPCIIKVYHICVCEEYSFRTVTQ